MTDTGSPGRGGGRRLVVQQSFPRPRPTTNPYLRLLGDAIARQPGVGVLPFSWRSALLGRYDVFHVHWPEILVQGASPVKTAVRQLLTLALVVRLAATRTPVVRTLHNVEAHEGLSRPRRLLLGLLDRRTTLVIRLTDSTPVPPGVLSETIPHGHYRDWYPRPDGSERQAGHVAYFGLIRPYKGVEDLVSVFRELPGDVSLTAAGKPSSDELRDELRRLADGDDRIDLDLRYLDDDALARTVGRAELVVLPHRSMHNSGSVLAALSLDRPVLVPATEINTRLAEEVGPEWVYEYDDTLRASDIERALEGASRLTGDDRPDLSGREWDDAGRRHVEAYRRAISAMTTRRGGRSA
ncbi:glycosyl transferase [Frondihabitans australicus]|uniref:Glycosyltransferase involved in cell wall biosynthesis n=1 Tax=Frondihabitans australicus TaxID=386892 RepID=A0A495ICV6_9MICO|nr:glycosyl transferase [Frondihabitans australicus]RKR72935.1 glycosyltransferase involved in cell wall biosynthesis [Frondihabitans australicus]